MKKSLQHLFCILSALLVLAGCVDVLVDEPKAPILSDEAEEFWHTRTLSKASRLELKRKYGIGFSYDAVYGCKCDINYVKCHALNIDELRNSGIMLEFPKNTFRDTCFIAHSFSEYCHAANLTGSASGDVVIYGADYSRVASIYEHGLDTIVYISNSKNIESRGLRLNSEFIEDIREEPERYLTPSFRYGIEKIRKTPVEEVMVVDSFVNIYGTHIVTGVTIGASLKLELKTRRGLFVDYKSEEIMTREKLNILFKKTESTSTKEEHEFMRQVLESSTIDLSVRGGDVSVFNSLLTDPSPTNSAATEETVTRWINSLEDDTENEEYGNLELIDMSVMPIWEFIADEQVAKRVKTRILADAPSMQELYGNRNWVNTSIDLSKTKYVNTFFNRWDRETWYCGFSDPYVVNVIAANRIVASVCREWIPEIDPDTLVTVVYPIYENSIDIGSGVGIDAECNVWSVSWRYNKFKVKKIGKASSPLPMVYLNFGTVETTPVSGEKYMKGNFIIGYERPGNINVTNGQMNDRWFTVRKFLGDFYLENAVRYNNLPNWEYCESPVEYPSYSSYMDDDLFEMVGLKVNGRTGAENLGNRMVRNYDYKYYLNKREAWYEWFE